MTDTPTATAAAPAPTAAPKAAPMTVEEHDALLTKLGDGVTAARVALRDAHNVVKTARRAVADAVGLYTGNSEAGRERIKRQERERQHQIDADIAAGKIQKPQIIPGPSHLDRVLLGGRGSVDRGYRRPFNGGQRGGTVAPPAKPKLPSER
jgi:hypothetical protein